jgi:ABC-type cobalamin/Fe3+-siderophores transport system ATPase subunit
MTLTLKNVHYRLQDKPLLDDIDLSFLPNRLYGIVGPNGAGKTTLLRAIAGLLSLSAGSICWQGLSILQLPRQQLCRLVTYVPQQPQLYFDFTVRELVAMGNYSQQRSYHLSQEAVNKALATVDLANYSNQHLSNLSGGERQRVYIARALVNNTPILLLDEPTTAVDIRHSLEIWKLLRELASERLVIVAHHDLATTTACCDELIVMKNGCCAANGQGWQVLTPDVMAAVFGVRIEAKAHPGYRLLGL